MLANTLRRALLICVLPLASYAAIDSALVGEWESISLEPDIIGRVTYSADHTWSGCIDDPRHGAFTGAGTWRVEGNEMISRTDGHSESRAEILAVTQNELQIKRSDGIVSTYVRIQ